MVVRGGTAGKGVRGRNATLPIDDAGFDEGLPAALIKEREKTTIDALDHAAILPQRSPTRIECLNMGRSFEGASNRTFPLQPRPLPKDQRRPNIVRPHSPSAPCPPPPNTRTLAPMDHPHAPGCDGNHTPRQRCTSNEVVVACQLCGAHNQPGAPRCARCGVALDVRALPPAGPA